VLKHLRNGEGEPLLLLHGLGGTRVMWSPIIEALAAEREILAPDLPGFGDSDPLEDVSPSPANMAVALAEFCESEGILRPHVAGNSLGGWVALEMGKAGYAASVTTLSAAGMWGKPLGPKKTNVRRAAKALRPFLGLILRTPSGRRAALASNFGHPEKVPADEARRMVLGWVDSQGYEEANREMRAQIFDPAGYPDIPVTLAWGELDRLVAPPRPHRIPEGARYIVLPGCGHTPTWDDPELVTKTLLEGSSIEASQSTAAG